jgi:ribose transport system substrate-binding protein
MKNRILLLVTILIASLIFSACASPATPVVQTVEVEKVVTQEVQVEKVVTQEVVVTKEVQVEAKPLTFGVVYNNLIYPWYQAEKAGIDRQAAQMGIKLVSLESRDDPAKELANVEDLVTQKVDAIILLGTDEATGGQSAKIAKDANIPLIALSRKTMGDVEPISTIATDTYNQAATIAKYMAEKLGGKGKVAQIQGVPGVANVRLRDEALKAVLKDYPNIQLVADVPGNFDPAKAEAAMSDILTAHPDIAAVYTHNDGMMVGVRRALEGAGKDPGKILTVAFDGEPVAIDAIRAGQQTATMGVVPAQEGAMGVIAAYLVATGKEVPKILYTPSLIYDKENVDNFPGWSGNGLGGFINPDSKELYDPMNMWGQ